jgi:midasin (ATPase involved in ribosome maturation)
VIVLSDGRFNKENVRRFMREAKEKKYLYIFVCLDKKGTSKDQSIMQMRSAVKKPDGGIKLDSYMKDFPFDYYCVVSDTSQLPAALGTILVQWFSMVSNSH